MHLTATCYVSLDLEMCERADYRITCTASTDISVSTAYADADELFYGHTCNDGELGMLLSVDGDEVVNSDNEGDLQRIRVVATGDEDTPEVIVTGLSDEKKLVHSELTRGCGCPEDCYSQFTEDEVYSIRLQMLELQKTEKEMLLLGKLQVCATPPDVVHHARKATKAKRRRITYQYAFDGRYVCKPAFCFLHCTGEKALKNLQHHFKGNGITPRTHGNCGRLPHNAFSFNTVQKIVSFISNYALVHGLPQPAAQSGRAETAPIYLPTTEGYNTVHQKYVQVCVDNGLQAAKYHAFRALWLQCVPHIKFMTPRTDVCHYCENFRTQLVRAITETDKTRLTLAFKEHVEMAQEERDYYLLCIKRAEESIAKEEIPQYGHYTFDFAQQLHVPYHARQVGPLYFKSPLKVHLFGICNDGTKLQVNYLYDESQCIGVSGTKAHGPNSVISMLHHYLDANSLCESAVHFHADNCVGQNKNRFVLGYFAWRVITGLNNEITLSFMRVGHTRCFVDGNFGLLKQCYRSADVDTVGQLKAVVERSSRTNAAQMYSWEWNEWDEMLGGLFRPIKGIRGYQHFRFSAGNGGEVFAKASSNGEETRIPLLKRRMTLEHVRYASPPRRVLPPGLSQDRKKYLYEQIRPHVWPEFQDITCPRP